VNVCVVAPLVESFFSDLVKATMWQIEANHVLLVCTVYLQIQSTIAVQAFTFIRVQDAQKMITTRRSYNEHRYKAPFR
jgi:hypothetical protein